MVKLFLFRLGSLLSLLILLVWEAFYRQNGGDYIGMKFNNPSYPITTIPQLRLLSTDSLQNLLFSQEITASNDTMYIRFQKMFGR